MKFIIASDHAGRDVKERFKDTLESLGVEYEDLSPENGEGDDYPDYAEKVVSKVKETGCMGFLSCGTGMGVSMAANRNIGIRAALVHSVEDAELARKHNDANILVLGNNKMYNLKEITKTFMNTSFEGGRHERRVKKLDE